MHFGIVDDDDDGGDSDGDDDGDSESSTCTADKEKNLEKLFDEEADFCFFRRNCETDNNRVRTKSGEKLDQWFEKKEAR